MLGWAYLPNCRLRHFLHGGRDARAPRGPSPGDFEGVLVEGAVAFDADFDYAVFPWVGDAHEDAAVFILALVDGGGFGLADFARDELASAGDAAAITASDWQRDAVGFANVEDGLVAAYL